MAAATMNTEQARFNMIQQQIRPWEVLDPDVLALLSVVKREEFVPANHRDLAFADVEVPLKTNAEPGQTMLAPRMEARLLQELAIKNTDKVLEIGTGSGYQCAVLSRLARFVYSVERYKSLLTEAEAKLKLLGVDNVFTRHGDGGQGWLEQAPFDRIMVTAASPHEPTELLKQLKPGGVLVAPVGRGSVQMLNRYTGQEDGSFRRESLCEVRFVPLVEGLAKEG